MRLLLFNLATDVDDPILGFATRWIGALAKRVESIHVITMRVGRVQVPDNVRVHSVGKEKGYSEPRRALEFYRHLWHILRNGRIDICFAHMMPLFTVLGAPVLRLKGIPIVMWYAHRQVTTLLKLAHHQSCRIVTVEKTSYRYKHDKVVVVGHGIDTDLFCPDGHKPEDPPLLLCVGRLSPVKDLLTLIEAVHCLRQRGDNVRCTLVGDAPEHDRPYAEAVRRRVRDLGLGHAVQFAEPVSSSHVVHWYRLCFAHVNCAPPDNALDKVVLEAMACGKPSLSSALGFQETMEEWADRLLFRHGDPEDLARKIGWLLRQSDAKRQTIGVHLRRSVIARHDLERLAECLVGLFAKVCRQ